LSNLISQVYKSKDGKMWMCTTSGLITYDGVGFKKYKFPTAPTISIGISKFLEDDNGVFWILNNGILYQFLNNTFHKKSSIDNIYLDIVNQNGEVYLSSFQNGIQHLNSNGEIETIWDINESHNTVVVKMLPSTDSTIFCLVNNQVISLNVSSKIYSTVAPIKALNEAGNIINIFQDSKNDLRS